MTTYATAVRKFRINFLFRAVIDANGNFCEASRTVGIHRNTLTRILEGAGYPSAYVKRLIERQRAHGIRYDQAVPLTARKPVQREIPPSIDDLLSTDRRPA